MLVYYRTVMYYEAMTTKEIGETIKNRRKALGLNQADVALGCHVGSRFLSDLENGKETAEIGKVLLVLQMLGIEVSLSEAN